jgi:hypothetical protein
MAGVYGGVAAGLVVALAVSVVEVLLWGWWLLPQLLLYSTLFPAFGVWAAARFRRNEHDGARPRKFRPTTGTLMLLVAYFGWLCGIGTLSLRLVPLSEAYRNKALRSESFAANYNVFLAKFEPKVKARRESYETLKGGKIPGGLEQGQKDFLRSLDRSATPEYRSFRYGLITEGEKWQWQLADWNVRNLRGLIDYHRNLALKYRKGMRRPWLPVSPDPAPPVEADMPKPP